MKSFNRSSVFLRILKTALSVLLAAGLSVVKAQDVKDAESVSDAQLGPIYGPVPRLEQPDYILKEIKKKDDLLPSLIDNMEDLVGNVGSMADTAQRATSDRFNRFILTIDDFFGAAESTTETKRSWGRLRIDGVRSADDEFEAKVRLKLRVVLPRTEQRLRLLLSTEESDNDSTQNQAGLEAETNDQNVALALRLVRSFKDRVRLKFDIGTRQRDSQLQLFGRISASNTMELPFGWEQRISNNFFLYSASGYQNKFKLEYRRPFTSRDNVFFRSATSIEGNNGVSGVSINETIGFYVDVSDRTVVAFEGLYDYVTSKNEETNTRYLGSEYRIRFRQNIWRPYFFYEIWPTVSFPATSDFELEYGGLARIELLFGQF